MRLFSRPSFPENGTSPPAAGRRHAPEAFERLEVTEYSAVAAIAARSFGGLRPITDAQVEDLVTAFDLLRE